MNKKLLLASVTCASALAITPGGTCMVGSEQNLVQLYLATLVEQPIVRRTAKQYGREQLERSMREHDELIQAFVVRDAAWAEAVMTAHIRRAYHAFSEAAPRLRVLE